MYCIMLSTIAIPIIILSTTVLSDTSGAEIFHAFHDVEGIHVAIIIPVIYIDTASRSEDLYFNFRRRH